MKDQNDFSLIRRLRPLLVAATAAALSVGCTQNVDAVGDGSGGDGGTGGQSTTASTGGEGGANVGPGPSSSSVGGAQQGSGGEGGATLVSPAIAMLTSEIPEPGTGGGGTSSVSSGPEPDPNGLHVYISNTILQCAAPYELDCGSKYTVAFTLPVELQQPGTYQLEQINGFFSSTGAEPVDCSFGGGSFWDGSVEITEIDANHVVGTLVGTSTFEFDANGPFEALRCFQ